MDEWLLDSLNDDINDLKERVSELEETVRYRVSELEETVRYLANEIKELRRYPALAGRPDGP